jgi:hypothetical protein
MAFRSNGLDRILEIGNAPGTGNVALGGAVPGFRTFASALAANDTCAYYIEGVDANGAPTGPWERGCGTFLSGPAFNRTIVIESSYGAGVASFTGNVRIGCAPMSDTVDSYQAPGGRLTLVSGTPVADSTGSGAIYYTPYLHDRIALWNGAGWQVVQFVNTGLAVTATAGVCYDVFGYLSGKSLALETLAWASLTGRTTGLTYVNGYLVKTGDATRLYLGSFYAYSTNAIMEMVSVGTAGAPGRRHLWNMYNRVMKPIVTYDNTGTWTYSANAWQIIRGQTAPNECLEMMRGLDQDAVHAIAMLSTSPNSTGNIVMAVGIDGVTNVPIYASMYGPGPFGENRSGVLTWSGTIGQGYHYLALLANAAGSSGGSIGWNYGACGIWGTCWC